MNLIPFPLLARSLRAGWFACLLLLIPDVQAQWRTQEIPLQPGWNAVFLEVDPEPATCESVLAGIPVESVWLHQATTGAPQFISDPRQLTPKSPDWLVYVPQSHPGGAGIVSTLFALPGGRPYLVKLAGTNSVTWTVQGQPRIRPHRWIGRSFNLVGFHLDPANSITVGSFFAPSRALAGQEVYDLDVSGEWRPVANRNTTRLQPGRAYWVYAAEATDYSGPLQITPDQPGEMAFGSLARTATLRVANLGTSSRRLTLRVLPSEVPPGDTTPANAGPVALGFLADGTAAYAPVAGPLNFTLGPGLADELRFELRRQEMAAFAVPAGRTSARYQGLLELSDNAGMRVVLPLSAESATQPANPAASPSRIRVARSANGTPDSPFAGLWAGVVAATAVSEPRNNTDPVKPRPAGSEFQFRVLLHVDASGATRLLREALILFKPGSLTSLPGTTLNELDVPGEYVIATDDSLLSVRNAQGQPVYVGSTLRDGERVGRRLSSANFSFAEPLPLTGEFGRAGNSVSGQYTIGFNDPLHPFKHLYHPDHDNRDREFKPYATGGEESWDLTRQVRFEFTAGDPDPNAPPQAGLGAEILAGRYFETILGLHHQPLNVSGLFRLQRVLRVEVLNDGR